MKFEKLQNKDTFLDPTLRFLKSERSDDIIRSWGTTVLETIASDGAFKGLIELLRTEDKIEKKFQETRLFAVRAIARLAQEGTRKKTMIDLLQEMVKDEDEAPAAKVAAMIVFVKESSTDLAVQRQYEKDIEGRLNPCGEYWQLLYTLRAIREVGYPLISKQILKVLDESTVMEHKRYAIKILPQYRDDDEVIGRLGILIKRDRDSSLRLEAVKSLALMKNVKTQEALLSALLDSDAEIRYQASIGLKEILGGQAVQVIIQSALEGKKDEASINQLIDALRIVDEPDRGLSTQALNKEIVGEDRGRAELAQKILLQLGGWAAVQRLSQRRSTIETLDRLLQNSEDVVRGTYEATILQARRNFYFAMGVNITIVIIGIILVSIAIIQVIREPSKLESWIIPGVSGLFGIMLTLFFNNPRNNAREDLATLINASVIFFGFMRRLYLIDAAFRHAYIESSGIQGGQDVVKTAMTSTVAEIKKTMSETLGFASTHLSKKSPGTTESQENMSKKEGQNGDPS